MDESEMESIEAHLAAQGLPVSLAPQVVKCMDAGYGPCEKVVLMFRQAIDANA